MFTVCYSLYADICHTLMDSFTYIHSCGVHNLHFNLFFWLIFAVDSDLHDILFASLT